ncbi:DUF4838 domain-containing protein [Wenyingzhuangia sp. IMCC45574]
MKKFVLAFLMLFTLATFSQEKDIYFYQKGISKPVIYLAKYSNVLTRPLSLFQKEIYNRSGLRISFSSKKQSKGVNVLFKVTESISRYNVVLNGNDLEISASNEKGFVDAVNYIMNEYFSVTLAGDILIKRKMLKKPIITSSLEYKEVYFSQNFKETNRSFYHTNYLELEWGLWGHNIHKWVKKEKPSDLAFALHNGKRNYEQLCFSSTELESLIHKNIKQSIINDSSLKRFMIAPFDNTIVCQCPLCKAKGNTKKSATPAVYSLLTKLAKTYPKLSFWSLGYVTTKNPPSFKLPHNVGVLLSTIDCQEALPLKSTPKGRKFLSQISDWNSKIGNIYIWDYVVNFDNYMDFYPIYKSTQQNIKSYTENGVTGLFLHGSGYDYSVLEEVKYHVLANLLNNPDASVEKLIKEGVERYYPELKSILFKYLTTIEDRGVRLNKKQNIYSGLEQAKNRYLELAEIKSLLKEINKFDSFRINKVKIGLLYLELELMRINSMKKDGFIELTNNSMKINPFINSKLNELKELVNKTGLFNINEKKDEFLHYISQWHQLLNRIYLNNSYYKNNIRTFSKLDEDYSNIGVLNDGSFGFNNYNDNWLIYSGKELLLTIDNHKCVNKEITKLEIGFLGDTKHRIYLPSLIQIYNENNKLIKEVALSTKKTKTPYVQTQEILLPKTNGNFLYNIRFVNKNRSIAIDEIRFLK